MGQALYRKHRPKKLSDVVGQEHITQTLEQAIKRGKISHAYLFTGPRGVGKTSIARILAHEINDLPYTDDSMHMDIIEIDAASNRRIDEIRELREKVYVAPSSAKYKVYIIDEVHMLTREAFNALLKTLEEPPAHVVFILATTDAHKLPETIISRTQRYNFKPVSTNQVTAHLQVIAKEEGIVITNEALELLAAHGEGSFRDSIGMLDQAGSHGKKLDISDIQTLLGIPAADSITQLLTAISQQAASSVMLQQLTELYNQGYQASAIASQLAQQIRLQLAENQLVLPLESALNLLGNLIEVPVAYDSERYLEIVLLQYATVSAPAVVAVAAPAASSQAPPTDDKKEAAAEPPADQVKSEPSPVKPPLPASEARKDRPPHDEAENDTLSGNVGLDSNLWPQILAELKQRHNTLYGVVRMAEPVFLESGGLQLNFGFAFHQKRISEPGNRQVLITIIHKLTGRTVSIECTHTKGAVPPKPTVPAPPAAKPSADLNAISNIFGGGELLES